MKIAISVVGQTLDDQVDPRFGRCQAFLIVDADTMEFEAVASYKAGKLQPSTQANVDAHSGSGRG